jgi:hypothetical protein
MIAVKLIGRILFILPLVFGMTATVTYSEDDAPPAWLYKLKRMNVRGFSRHQSSYAWVVTGSKTSVVFADDFDDGAGTYDLVSYCPNQLGRVKTPAEKIISGLISDDGFPSLAVSPVWLESVPGAVTGQVGQGVLFAVYDPTGESERLVLVVTGFDAAGKRVGGLTKLMEIRAPNANSEASLLQLKASRGENSIGVSISVTFLERSSNFAGWNYSEGYFFETDLNGAPIGAAGSPSAARKISLPKGGKMRAFFAFEPAWNGDHWLIPCSLTKYKIGSADHGNYKTTMSIGEDVSVVVVPNGASKLKTRKLFGHNNPNYQWSYTLQFLPRESGGAPPQAAGDNLDMFYQFAQSRGSASQQGLDSFDYTYGILKVDGNGRQIGNDIIVDVPLWKHRIEYETGWYRNHSFEYLSRVIEGPEGKLYFGLTRTLEMYKLVVLSPALPLLMHDHLLELYSLDRESGELSQIAYSYPQIGDATFRGVWIGLYRGAITLVNTSLMLGKNDSNLCYDYFTKFTGIGN